MKKTALTVAVLLAAAAFAGWHFTRGPRRLSGPPDVPNFVLRDQNGKPHTLYDYANSKAVVLIGYGNSCPIVQRYVNRIKELSETYAGRGFTFLLIDANTQDDAAGIAAEAKEWELNLPILLDPDQIVARTLGFKRTTESLVISTGDWKIRYRGAINDELGYSVDKGEAKHEWLADAMDAYLAGRESVNTPEQVKGCIYSYWKSDHLTYAQHIAPLIAANCTSCHAGPEHPPLLASEADLRASAEKIRTRFLMGGMPHAGGKLESQDAYHLFMWLGKAPAPVEATADNH